MDDLTRFTLSTMNLLVRAEVARVRSLRRVATNTFGLEHLRDMENALIAAHGRINRELMDDEAKDQSRPKDEKIGGTD